MNKHGIKIWSASLLATLLSTAAAAQDSTGDELFRNGRDALFRGNYKTAISMLEKAVATDEDGKKTAYRLYLAKAYRYAKRGTEAEPLLRYILEVSPDHVEAGRALAEIYAAKKEWQSILEVLEPLLEYRHDYPTYHLLAEAAYHLNKTAKARVFYQRAVQLNPRSAADHYQLGNLLLADNAFASAAAAYRAALDLGLESPTLHYKLASSYFNLRNYFGKISRLTVKGGKAGTIHDGWFLIEPVPGHRDTFLSAPEDSAIFQVTKAIADGLADRPDIHVLRANIYLNTRRFKKAHAMFEKIAATIPKKDEALFYYYYAQAAFGIGKMEDYLRLLNEAIKRDKAAFGSNLVIAYVKVAEQHNQGGDLEQYIEYIGKAVAESPRSASLHLQLGNAYAEARRYANAVVQWQMVLDLDPHHPRRTALLNLIKRHRKA